MTSPAFQFYPSDWLSSSKVMLMTPEQEGAYIHLLAYCWLDPQCTLPDDDDALAKLSRLGEGWLKGGSTVVRECFPKHPQLPGRLWNPRLFKEREKQQAWRDKSRQGGINSGHSRRCDLKGGSQMVQPNVKGGCQMVEPKGNSSSSSSSSVQNINRNSQNHASMTLEECFTLADMRAIPRDVAEAWWLKMEGQGWVTDNGQPVFHAEPLLRKYANSCRANQSKEQQQANRPTLSKRPLSVLDLKTIRDAKEVEANALKHKYSFEAASETVWNSTERKAQYRNLRAEIKQLTHQIATKTTI